MKKPDVKGIAQAVGSIAVGGAIAASITTGTPEEKIQAGGILLASGTIFAAALDQAGKL